MGALLANIQPARRWGGVTSSIKMGWSRSTDIKIKFQLWLFVEYQRLNATTILDSYPLKREILVLTVEKILKRLQI